jgi:hypothetical protein
MAATTTDIMTKERTLGMESYPVAATTKIPAGVLVAVNSSGYAVNAANSASLRIVGVAHQQADNTSGAAGDLNVKVISNRIFTFAVTGTAITDADVGEIAYVSDNQTVKIAAAHNIAGKVIQGDSTTADIYIPHPGYFA